MTIPTSKTDEAREPRFRDHSRASSCIQCGEPPLPNRRLCAKCRAAKEAERRERVKNAPDRPCSVEGCEEVRHRLPSQQSAYCKEHLRQKNAESRGRTRPRERVETRTCERNGCGNQYEWRSTHAKQRYCSKACYTQGVLDERQRKRDERMLAALSETHRWCGGCQAIRPVEDFSPSMKNYCRDCQRAAQKRYEAKHPERRKGQQRAAARKRRFAVYGITPEEFDLLVEQQNGRCLICDRDDDPLVPDHCHNGGGFRGAICGRCNKGLGQFADNVEWLARAADYLKG